MRPHNILNVCHVDLKQIHRYNTAAMMNERHDEETLEDDEIIDEDTTDTDVSLEDEESQSSDKIKQLRAKLKESEEARVKLLEEFQGAKAEFLNARKRLESQKNVDIERATIRHIEDILPLADSFEMAMKDPAWADADEVWRKGVEGIYAQLQNILKSNGVSAIDAQGATFNPHEHEALTGEGETVTEVYQKGYKLRDTVIRPAKVSV